MDGWITIGTRLETDKFDRQVTELENRIKQEEEKQKMKIEVNSQLEQEQAKLTAQAQELAKQYTEAANEADRLYNTIKTSKPRSFEAFTAQQEFDVQTKKIDELNAKIEETQIKQGKVAEKIAKNNLQYQASIDKVAMLNGKIDEIGLKREQINVKREQANAKREQVNAKLEQVQLAKVEKNVQNIEKGLTGAIGKIGKLALAVLSIRSAYSMIMRASSTLQQYNKQYATDLEYMRFAIAQGLAPILEKVVQLAQTLMAYVNYLAQRLLGVNLFAKGSADEFRKAKDSMGGMAKSSKEIKNNLASFDELNVLSNPDDTSGAEALAPSIDIGGLENVEIPEWLQKLGDLVQPIGEAFRKLKDELLGLNIPAIMDNIGKGITRLASSFMKFIEPLKDGARLEKQVWLDVWQTIKEAWDKWAAPIWEHLNENIVKFGELMQTLWSSFLEPIWNNLVSVLGELWDNHLKPLWDNLVDFLGQLIDGMLVLWGQVIEPLLNWLIQTFGPSIAEAINQVITRAGMILGVVADVINGIIRSLKGIIEFVVGVFTGDWEKAWQGIVDFFGGIWDGIVAIVKGAVNLVIDLINGMLGGLEKGLNFVVDKINSLKITDPWGDEIWSPSIPRFDFGRIPKLARGGIVARPTQAVIGEAGREAVMPLDNNTEWMDVLADKLGSRNDNITIRFTGSTAQLVRLLKPELEKEEKRTGKRLIVGGVY